MWLKTWKTMSTIMEETQDEINKYNKILRAKRLTLIELGMSFIVIKK